MKRFVTDHFNQTRWHELSFALGCPEIVSEHPRLFDSFRFGDDDYEQCVTEVLQRMMAQGEDALDEIESYIASLGDVNSTASLPTAQDAYVVRPTVFKRPMRPQEASLVAVMMPFKGNGSIYEAIKAASGDVGLRAVRADEVWDDVVIHQDIFDIIHQSSIVVCDFTGRNPNVYYETGIAHTLGREVVPIAQDIRDVPSDLIHHRALAYHSNPQGLADLRSGLAKRLSTVVNRLKALPLSPSLAAIPGSAAVGVGKQLEHDQGVFSRFDGLASESQLNAFFDQLLMNAGMREEIFGPIGAFLKASVMLENRFIDDEIQRLLVEYRDWLETVNSFMWEKFDHPPAQDHGRRRDPTMYLHPKLRLQQDDVIRDSPEWKRYEREMERLGRFISHARGAYEAYRTAVKKRLFV